jgi:4-aminobutyrate aminotransferase-like enzyme
VPRTTSTESLVARRDGLLGRHTRLFYERPVHLVRGEGAYVFDAEGRRYVDLYNNIPVVGHCNPRVVAALTEQAAKLVIHGRYLDETILDYAERLLGVHAEGIDRVVFTCTGTEANEVAMQMARLVSAGRGFICSNHAYHGHTDLVGMLTKAPLRGRADVRAFQFPDLYRPQAPGLTDDEVCERAIGEVQSAIDDFAAEGVPLAGMVLCPIFANEGLPWIPAGFMAKAAAVVREAGGVVIFDEVQAGFCRTGRFWGYESTGVVPDIVTMGKPIGNGLPLGACAAGAEFVDLFRERARYFNTFASTALHGAVGLAVLDELQDRRLDEHAAAIGSHLKIGIEAIAAPYERVGAIRQRGLFLGIERITDRDSRTPDPHAARAACEALKDRGFLTATDGAFNNLVKVRPPLVIDQMQADLFLEAFADVLAAEGV